MKTYKLLKKYPGIPQDWEVGMTVGQGERGVQGGFSPCNAKYSDNKRIPFNDVICNPEYWQEQEDFRNLDYEIIQFKDGCGYSWTRIKGTNEFSANIGCRNHSEQHLLSTKCEIYKVKRLSDNAIFELGKYVGYDPAFRDKITGFDIRTDALGGMMIYTTDGGGTAIGLKIFHPAPEKLFTTHDGVEIFEGDSWFYYVLESGKIAETSTLEYKGDPCNKKEVLRFSSREAICDYLESREPLFVTEDGVELFHDSDYKNIYGVALQATGTDVIRKGYTKGIGEYAKPYKNRKWFMYRHNAEMYVTLNKRCLSIMDVAKIFKTANSSSFKQGERIYCKNSTLLQSLVRRILNGKE